MEKMTNNEQQILDNLKKIIEFGGKAMGGKSIKIHHEDSKQFELFLMFAAVHNYSEAIYTLCLYLKPKPATSILRSILEGYINLLYIFSGDVEKRMALFGVQTEKDHLKLFNQLLDFIDRYPEKENSDLLTSRSFLKEQISKVRDRIEKIKTANSLSESDVWEPALLNRAKIVDSETTKKGDTEYNYHIAYRYFSPYAHLDATGLNHFAERNSDGSYTLAVSTSKKEFEPVVVTTFAFYLEFLHLLKNLKLIPENSDLKPFDKMLEEMNQSKKINPS